MHKWIMAAGLVLAAVTTGYWMTSPGTAAGRSCAEMATGALENVTIETAEAVRPDPTWPFPPSLFNNPSRGPTAASLPFCRVAGTIEKEIRFEVWLPPLDRWNGKYQGVGNGGFSGGINYPAMYSALKNGYAAASTDTGHTTDGFFEVSWIPGHRDRVVNFLHRAQHLLATTAKAIVTSRYGQGPEFSYFSGCSTGGWQGLTEAQKYPDDYDGIVAGAPANNFIRLQAFEIFRRKLMHAAPDGNIPPQKGKLLAAAAVRACDADDGVEDGLISAPRQCDFDPASLQCRGEDTSDCLTPSQVEHARQLYGRRESQGGMKLYPGPAPGTPLRSGILETDEDGETTPPAILLMLQALGEDVDWTVESFDVDRHLPEIERKYADLMATTKTDLSAFAERGGKIISYHGWIDPALSPYNSIDYYTAVQAAMGRQQTEDFYRLFMVPGMAHCRGGPGPDAFDAVAALDSWVESGQAPERLIAAKMRGGEVERTRPLCTFPKRAYFKGEGSPDDADNFVCREEGSELARQE